MNRHAAVDTDIKPQALWKDVVTEEWKGPSPVLIWGRGHVCVFPQEEKMPIWIPERLVRAVKMVHQDAAESSGYSAATDDGGEFHPG